MEPDEREVLKQLIRMFEITNKRMEQFTKYVICLLIAFLLTFSMLLALNCQANNKTIREMSRIYGETDAEKTRLSFETDYLYPETIQTQTIGDIN